MASLRSIILRFDTHDFEVTPDKIISVDATRAIIGSARKQGMDVKLGPWEVTIVVEATEAVSYVRSEPLPPPPEPDRPRRLLRRRNP